MAGDTIYITWSGGPAGDYIVSDNNNAQITINQALADNNGAGNIIKLRGSGDNNNPHIYWIRNQIRIGNSTVLTAEPGVKVKVADYACGNDIPYGSPGAQCTFPDGTPVLTSIAVSPHGIEITGFDFDGNAKNQYTKLGLTHGVPRSAGSGVERAIGFSGVSGSGKKAEDIHIHHMTIRDFIGDGVRVIYGRNVRVHDCFITDTEHDCVFMIEVSGSGNAVYNNVMEGIGDSCLRLDNCQNFKVYGNIFREYNGTTHNASANPGGENGIQLANESNKTLLTSNIDIYNNKFENCGNAGMWINDVKKTAGTSAQTAHIFNNEFIDCGESCWTSYACGISINPWGNGLVIENNTFNGCYQNGIQILNTITTSGLSVSIKNNNFLNTRGKRAGSSGSGLSNSVVGYAIYNAKPSAMVATIEHNYFSGNSKGAVYPTNLSHTNDATTANGILPGYDTGGDTGGGYIPPGGDTTVPVRYIPRTRAVRESLAEYFLSNYHVKDSQGRDITGYVNKYPIRISGITKDSNKVLVSNKSPSVDGVNQADMGWEGSNLTINCKAHSLDDMWRAVSAWKSRSPAIVELGGIYTGWFLSGTVVRIESDIQYDRGDIPSRIIDYSVAFETDTPFFRSTTERIRTRKIYNTMQFSSDDTYAGNLLQNPSFESWTTGEIDVAPDRWTLETTGQALGDLQPVEGANCMAIIGDGRADLGGIVQPVACEAGVTYILSAYGAAYNLTSGQLQVELYSGGAVVAYLAWSADCDWTQKQVLVRYDVAPTDAVIRVHAVGINEGAIVYSDNLYFGKKADLEIAAVGNEIITYGYEDVIPDFEVAALVPENNASDPTDVPGNQVTCLNWDDVNKVSRTNVTFSCYETEYSGATSTQVTVTLPALPSNGKYRIDEISCQLATQDSSSYTAYCQVTIQAPSLYGGAETQIVEWTENAIQPAYVDKSHSPSNLISANEQVIIRFKLKTTNSAHRAFAKSLTLKYTPLTPSTGAYGDIAGSQVSEIHEPGVLYTTAQTEYNATSLQWTEIIPALPGGAKLRLDQVSFELAKATNASYYAYAQVTIQAASLYGGAETQICERSSDTANPTFTPKIVNFGNILAGNEQVTLRYYIRTTSADPTNNRAQIRNMGYRYTPMVPQSAPDPSASSTTVSIYNTADPTRVLDMCNTILPHCRIAINSDYTGSFEYSDNLSDSIYKSIVVDQGTNPPVYSASTRTLTFPAATPANSYLTFKFDTKYPVTGIPFLQLYVVSGTPEVYIAAYDPVYKQPGEWYLVDSHVDEVLTNANAYRELDNAANLHLAKNSVYYICIKPKAGTELVLGAIYHYADLVTIDADRPRIFAGSTPNTFRVLLNGNPVNLTLRYRDTNMVV